MLNKLLLDSETTAFLLLDGVGSVSYLLLDEISEALDGIKIWTVPSRTINWNLPFRNMDFDLSSRSQNLSLSSRSTSLVLNSREPVTWIIRVN